MFFGQLFCVFLTPLLYIFCFCEVHTIFVLYRAHLCMKYFLGISNFLEEISSLSHSVLFLYFFALTTEEGFLISPSYFLELCIQMGISFFFSFAEPLLCQKMVCMVKALVFPVVIYRCEGWAIKKAVKVKVTQSCLTLCNPMDYTFSGAGYWIG